MKKYLSNALFLFLLGFFAYRQLPAIISNYKQQGQVFSPVTYNELITNKEISLFESQENYIVFFWASWCAPCKLDMQRLRQSVDNKKIPKSRILLVNIGEPTKTIENYIKKNQLPFTFINDRGELVKKLNIKVTPTMALIEKGELSSLSSGLSLIGIYRAENLFN